MKRYRVGDRVYLDDGTHRFWPVADGWRWALIEWPDDARSYYGRTATLEEAQRKAKKSDVDGSRAAGAELYQGRGGDDGESEGEASHRGPVI